MEIIKHFKGRLIFFVVVFALSVFGFSATQNSKARENAFIATLIDDESNMYKTQVIYSGAEIESCRIGYFTAIDLAEDEEAERLDIWNYTSHHEVKNFGDLGDVNIDTTIDQATGKISINVITEDSLIYDGKSISSETWAELIATKPKKVKKDESKEMGNVDTNALTFPAGADNSANEADINRAYSVASTMGTEFSEALLFVNDGQSFTSVDALVDTAFALCSIDGGKSKTTAGTLVNQYGHSYQIEYETAAEDDDMNVLYCNITKLSATDAKEKNRRFICKIKKGYKFPSEYFEDGTLNKLNESKSADNDSTFITWQQMFIEAGIFYAQGITYANQGDLYKTQDFENAITNIVRNVLSQLKNVLSLYETEDCIFNSVIRGTSAFTYGIYKESYNHEIFRFYMIMLSIALSFIVIAIISMTVKKQWSTVNPSARFSLMSGVKDLIVVCVALVFLWIIMKLIFMSNFRFVEIWNAYRGDRKFNEINATGYLGQLIYAFVFFVMQTYINVLYILRGLMVPFLIIIAPLCVFVYCLGDAGKKVTASWAKELLGNVFIQSAHAVIFGFILAKSNGQRGIESIVVLAAIIPVTKAIKTVAGVGGDELFRKAASFAGNTVSSIGSGVQTAANVGGSVASAGGAALGDIGGAVSNTGSIAAKASGATIKAVGNVGKVAGGSIQMAGGAFNTGMGIGSGVVLDDSKNVQQGLAGISGGANQIANGVGGAVSTGINLGSQVAQQKHTFTGSIPSMGPFNSAIGVKGMSNKYAASLIGKEVPINKGSMIHKGQVCNVLQYPISKSGNDTASSLARELIHANNLDKGTGSRDNYNSFLSKNNVAFASVKKLNQVDSEGKRISVLEMGGVNKN